MANALNVICNRDLFLYMQEFMEGYNGKAAEFQIKYYRCFRFTNLIQEAIANRNWEQIEKFNIVNKSIYKSYFQKKWKVNFNDWKYPHTVFSCLSTCEWIHQNAGRRFVNWREYMDIAVGLGDWDFVLFMHENRPEGCTMRAMDGAASHGHLRIVKFLHENRSEGCTTRAMDNAAQNGHLDVVQFLHENRKEGCTKQAMDNAIRNGHLDIVQFLHDHRSEGHSALVQSYIESSQHRGTLGFLHTKNHKVKRKPLGVRQFFKKLCKGNHKNILNK